MINFQEIIENSLLNVYETILPLLLLSICVAIVLFYFRYEISYSNKERRKIESSLIGLISITFLSTLAYLIINEYFILLFLLTLILIILIIYKIGLLDNSF